MTGIELIAEERKRQIEKEGYDNDHDSYHDNFELTKAAICYANRATMDGLAVWQDRVPNDWPFQSKWWKPEPRIQGQLCPVIETKDALKMLVKAGALIAAEIDRLNHSESITTL